MKRSADGGNYLICEMVVVVVVVVLVVMVMVKFTFHLARFFVFHCLVVLLFGFAAAAAALSLTFVSCFSCLVWPTLYSSFLLLLCSFVRCTVMTAIDCCKPTVCLFTQGEGERAKSVQTQTLASAFSSYCCCCFCSRVLMTRLIAIVCHSRRVCLAKSCLVFLV